MGADGPFPDWERAAERQDRAADQRDDDAAAHDELADERDHAGRQRDAQARVREQLAQERETAALQRDWAATTRDHQAQRRELGLVIQRERPPDAGPWSSYEQAAIDRELDASDRREAAPDRALTAQDRAAAAQDQRAAAVDRAAAAEDRDSAKQDRVAAAQDRFRTAADRAQTAMSVPSAAPTTKLTRCCSGPIGWSRVSAGRHTRLRRPRPPWFAGSSRPSSESWPPIGPPPWSMSSWPSWRSGLAILLGRPRLGPRPRMLGSAMSWPRVSWRPIRCGSRPSGANEQLTQGTAMAGLLGEAGCPVVVV